MNPPRNRPVGVMLFAILFLWIGGSGTLIFPLFMFSGSLGPMWPPLLGSFIHSDLAIRILGAVVTLIWFLAYVAYLVIGIGLLKLKNWARKAVLVVAALCVLLGMVAGGVLVARSLALFGLACALWSASICGWQAWYFMRPRVLYAFGEWRRYTPTGEWIEPPGLTKRGRIVVGVAVPVTTLVLFGSTLFFAIDSMMHNSEAYRMSMETAQASPCVVKALGTPLKAGFIEGGFDENGQTGSAEYDFSVQGPKGKGYLSVEAKKAGGKWALNSLRFSHNAHDVQIVPATSDMSCE